MLFVAYQRQKVTIRTLMTCFFCKKITHIFLLLAAFLAVSTNTFAEEVTIKYVFNSNVWGAQIGSLNGEAADWECGKGVHITKTLYSDRGHNIPLYTGVNVTDNYSGAYATSPIEFSNISKIVVHYANSTSGSVLSTVSISVGGTSVGAAKQINNVGDLQETEPAELVFNIAEPMDGKVKIQVDVPTNGYSVYIYAISITYDAAVPTFYERNIEGVTMGSCCVKYPVSPDGISGARFYSLAGMLYNNVVETPKPVYALFNSEHSLQAGKPYFFFPEQGATTLRLDYADTSAPTAAIPVNGVFPTFSTINIDNVDSLSTHRTNGKIYIVYQGKLCPAGTNNRVTSNHCYVNINYVRNMGKVSESSGGAPGGEQNLKALLLDDFGNITEVLSLSADEVPAAVADEYSIGGVALPSEVTQQSISNIRLQRLSSGETRKVLGK